jgi:integrase/recombinase XerD
LIEGGSEFRCIQLALRYDSVVLSYRIGMAGKQAKVLFDHHVQDLLAYASASRYPVRNRVIVLLSVKAGLRAGEIANLTWPMVVDPTGEIAPCIELHDGAAKMRSGRRVPLHNDLREGLARLREATDGSRYVAYSERGGGLTPSGIVNWFTAAYRHLGLAGCSSHSGRRTFITRAARLVHKAGGSLRDVQLLAGHRSIQTTQAYIDGDTDVQRRLVGLI